MLVGIETEVEDWYYDGGDNRKELEMGFVEGGINFCVAEINWKLDDNNFCSWPLNFIDVFSFSFACIYILYI